MNNLFRTETWNQISKPKLILIILIVVFGAAVILTILRSMFFGLHGEGVYSTMNTGGFSDSVGYGLSAPMMMEKDGYYNNMAPARGGVMSMDAMEEATDYSMGGDAEDYEALSYNARIKTGDLDGVCNKIEEWKPLSHVVFEHSSRHDTSCYYRFKVEREQVEAMVSSVKELEPEDFTANIDTLKRQVVEYDSRLTILLRRQEILESTLEDATTAYDSIVALATQVEDVESLTKVINSKLATVERLTDQRESLSQQMDILARQMSEAQDRIGYVSFSVRADKHVVMDLDAIKNSWVSEVRGFVRGVNEMVQNLTLGLVGTFLMLLQFIVYLALISFVILITLKVGWRTGKKIWQGKPHQEYSE